MMTSKCWDVPKSSAPELYAEELELSSHIRHLLFSYVQTYITTPYIQFTEVAVSELIADLKPIPVHDPASLTLPTDPLTVYLSTFANTLEPYVEKLQTTNEARLLIKRLLASKPPRVANISDEDDENCKYHRPSTPPILTRRAVRETPVIGKKYQTSNTYAAYTKTAMHQPLCPVPVPEVPEPQVNFNQVLGVKHYIRTEDHTAVRALLKSAAKPPAPTHTHPYLPSSLLKTCSILRQPTPPPDSPPFMPIFPRRIPICPPGKKKRRRDSPGRCVDLTKKCKSRSEPQSIPESMKDMPMLVKPTSVSEGSGKADVAVEDLDLYEENMVVVDGWQTFVTSSPSILSSNSNEEDQLLLPSSPDTDVGTVALVKAVEDSKLEDVLIPRNRKVGGKPFESGRKAKDPGSGRAMGVGYGQFLTPLLRPESNQKDTITAPTTSCKLPTPCLELEEAEQESSLLGQASCLSDPYTYTDEQDDDNSQIHRLYAQMSAAFGTPGLKSNAGSREEHRERNKLPVHPYSLIKDEPLFEDDGVKKSGKCEMNTTKETNRDRQGVGTLIPVPNLPEPNTYAATLKRPTTLTEYIAPTSEILNDTGDRSREFLRKAKGTAGLRVALSWIPFTFPSTKDPPTHATVTSVDKLFGDTEEETERNNTLVQELLGRAAVTESPTLGGDGERYRGVDERLWSTLGDNDEGGRSFPSESKELLRYEIILTREERLGVEMRKYGDIQRSGLVQATLEVEGGPDKIHSKRKSIQDEQSPGGDGPQYKKKRHSLRSDEFNDSGIVMRDGAHDFVNATNKDGEILDFDAEFDQEHEMLDYVEGDVKFDPNVGGRIMFDLDDEKENRPLVQIHGGYLDNNGMGEQDDSLWVGERHNTIENTRGHSDNLLQSPTRNFGRDYTGGFLPQGYDALSGMEVRSKSSQHVPLGTNGFPDTKFDQCKYTDLNDVDPIEDYDCELLNDDQDYTGGSFEPLSLSFDSQSYRAASGRSSQVQVPLGHLSVPSQPYFQTQLLHTNDPTDKYTMDDSQNTQMSNDSITDFDTGIPDVPAPAITENQAKSPQDPSNLHVPALGPLVDLSFANHALGTATFARLRGKTLKESASTNPPPTPDSQVKSSSTEGSQVSRDPPVGLHDRRTLCLPSEPRPPVTTTHKYLASLDLLQKQALVRALRSLEHRIDLVERVTLDGADLILDVHASLIFVPLLSLPAQTQAEALLTRVACLSWTFERILIVFEAYPASMSVHAARSSSSAIASSPYVVSSMVDVASGNLDMYVPPEPGLYAYTPPVMKAIRKFRRDLDIAEACGKKSATCFVEYAFADSVNEAATFSRMFGDILEADGSGECGEPKNSNNQHGVLWNDRSWLEMDQDEDEDGLAVIPGMNRFKAAVVLSQIGLGDLLDLDPGERIEMFGRLIGPQSIMAFNEEIEQRLGAFEGYDEEQDNITPVAYY